MYTGCGSIQDARTLLAVSDDNIHIQLLKLLRWSLITLDVISTNLGLPANISPLKQIRKEISIFSQEGLESEERGFVGAGRKLRNRSSEYGQYETILHLQIFERSRSVSTHLRLDCFDLSRLQESSKSRESHVCKLSLT